MQFARKLLRLDRGLERIAHQMVVPLQPAVARHLRSLRLACRAVELLPGIRLKSSKPLIYATVFKSFVDFSNHLVEEPRREIVADGLF